ncbi:conserved protein of unknown function [Hyphomicrobium sp. 1Nfss2.1]|uniref:hypothetical protein n=1 Tax=Hyphomicrobium sp. 1Nfss2.1 TaxID=3413936 RepID=UPI003C7A36F2
MALSEAYVNSGTSISTTEYSLTNDSTTVATQTDDGLYQAFIDFSNMASGDTYVIRIYEKCYGAATQRVCQSWTLTGAQSDPIWVSPHLQLMHGWDITVQRTAGTDRSIAWSIRKVA